MITRTKITNSSGIYLILSFVNGKRYIGSACFLRRRRNEHLSILKKGMHNKYLQNHFNKYGENDLLFKIIEFCNKEKLIEREQYWLDLLHPEFNILKIAGSNMGSTYNDECKKKKSLRMLGNKYMLGKHHSEASKRRMRKTRLGSHWGNHTEETKQKMRKPHGPMREECIEKMRKPKTKQGKINIGIAAQNRSYKVHSIETRKLMSIGRKNGKQPFISKELRKQRSDRKRLYWINWRNNGTMIRTIL